MSGAARGAGRSDDRETIEERNRCVGDGPVHEEGKDAGETGAGAPLLVRPIRGLRGEATVPGDKSLSHRALILGALSCEPTRIANLSGGEDVASTRRCLEKLGASVEPLEDGLRIRGWGDGLPREPDDVLDAGNSGTTFRLLAGLLASYPIFSVLTGDASLRGRPMDRVAVPLRRMGARITGREQGRFAPVAIEGGGLRPIRYATPVASAQVKSALLLAGLRLSGETVVSEPALSRDHTERMLQAMGAQVRRDGTTVTLGGGRPLLAREFLVSGDPSSAAFLLVAALILPESDLRVRQVCVNPTRTGYLSILERMGAAIEQSGVRTLSGEPVADLRVRSGRLRAADILPADVPGCIDEIPILCVAAAMAEGTTTIRGAQELRVKESDRIAAMVDALTRMGVPVQETPDGMVIRGTGRIEPFQGASRGDHRVAMSMIVAALAARGPCRIEGASCASVSFPGFVDKLTALAAG